MWRQGLWAQLQQGKTMWAAMLVLFFIFFGVPIANAAKEEQNSKREKAQRLQTITVTAQKQEENLQDVPLSVTALSENVMADYNMDSLWKMSSYVPNLYLVNVGMGNLFAQPSMRGVSAPATTLSSSVGLYIDGVPILASPGFQSSLLDVERVEVLRGPQGTTYGKNTEVGAISVITRQPDNNLHGKIGVLGGEDRHAKVYGTMSGPLFEDRLYYSLAGSFDRKDGFIENTYLDEKDDDQKKWYGRGQLRWTPTDAWDISLILSRMASDEGGAGMTGSKSFYKMTGMPAPDRAKMAANLRSESRTTNDIQALKVQYKHSDSLSVTSITARSMADWYGRSDYDYSPMTLPNMHAYQDSQYMRISQELRLNMDYKPVRVLVGLYGDYNRNDIEIANYETGIKSSKNKLSGHSQAVFGQVDYAITDALSIIGGLRYEVQHNRLHNYLLNIRAGTSDTSLSPKLSLKYKLTPEIATYVTVAKGYRTGGFQMNSASLNRLAFAPEELWSYEVGVKSSFFDNRLLANISAYYMNIEDMQVEEWVTPIQSLTTNAAKAHSKGVELELQAQVTKGLTLMGSFGYNNTTFAEFEDLKGDYKGNINPFTPEYTFSVGGMYRHDSGLYLRGDVTGYGSMYMDKDNLNKKDAYMLTNAKIGYESSSYDVYLYANNIFDTEYDSKEYFGFYDILSPPREIGLEAVYRF